jgi:hypothetical protein
MLKRKKNATIAETTGARRAGALRRREFFGAAAGAPLVMRQAASAAASKGGTRPVAGGSVVRESLQTPIADHYQVVVAGGGPSGFIAALAAVRSGAKTLLIERYPFLGGNGTAGLMTSYNGFRNQRPPEALQTVKGIPAEYIAALVTEGGLCDDEGSANTYPQAKHDIKNGELVYSIGFDAEVAKVVMLQMIQKEGVSLLLHSWICGPMLDGLRVTGVLTESKSGRRAFAADIVVDATGDGDIAARAGAPFMGPSDQGDRMGMSLMYRVGGAPTGLSGIRSGDKVVRWGPGFSGDGLDAAVLTKAEVESRLKLWEQFKKMRMEPGMGALSLLQTATGVGVRETRRILGEYTVTEQDAIRGTRFPDVIAISSNPMPGYRGKRFFFEHEGFDIPYRSLIPRNVEGLVLTGRCISCEQAPFQSARSMAPAMAVGQASGCAAALAALKGVPPRKLDVKELQTLLLHQKAELRLPR